MTGAWLTPDWSAPACVHAVVTTRRMPGYSRPPFDSCNLGSRCGDDAQAVAANRHEIIDTLGLPSSPAWLHQVHGIGVVRVGSASANPAESEPEADAATTRDPGRVLAILTADCLPVLFCAEDGSEVSVAHAGWRGLAAGVLEQTVAAMQSAPNRILAWIGPAIGPDSYEVGTEVHAAFMQSGPAAASAFQATRPGHWLCDLPALARMRLQEAGLSSIGGGGFDTRTDPRFYSHRRDRRSGRFASLIWIS
ncbi:peptidoglycan editing factor PgeF [Dokdonella sp.]|uniref:peptidoglycan editing factor PgeF n=1 Tax=Dokdonella sp. TaxID=2291710 RepID=UPI0035276266